MSFSSSSSSTSTDLNDWGLPSSSSSSASVSSNGLTSVLKNKRKADVLQSNADGNESIKKIADNAIQIFKKFTNEVIPKWQKYNAASSTTQGRAAFKYLMTLPGLKNFVSGIFQSLPKEETQTVKKEEIEDLNRKLLASYQALKVHRAYNDTGLRLLKYAIQNNQIGLIQELLKIVDFSKNDQLTLECVKAAATNPDIALMILNAPGINFTESYNECGTQLFQLAIDFQDDLLFAKLESLNLHPDFTHLIKLVAGNDNLNDYLQRILALPNYQKGDPCGLAYNISIPIAINAKAYKNAKSIVIKISTNELYKDYTYLQDLLIYGISNNNETIIKLFDHVNLAKFSSKVIWEAVKNKKYTLATDFVKRGLNPKNAFKYCDESIFRYTDQNKETISFLVKLGADINVVPELKGRDCCTLFAHTLSTFAKKRKGMRVKIWRTPIIDCINWYISLGADPSIFNENLSKSPFMKIIDLDDQVLITTIITSSKHLSKDGLAKMLLDGFQYLVCNFTKANKEINFLYDIIVKNQIEIDLNKYLYTYLTKSSYNFEQSTFEFFIKNGANPFDKVKDPNKRPLLLECCWYRSFHSITALQKHEGFKAALEEQVDGFGIFTYLSSTITAAFRDEIFPEIIKHFSTVNNLHSFYKDIISGCVLLRAPFLSNNALKIDQNLINLMPWNHNKYIDLISLEKIKDELINFLAKSPEKYTIEFRNDVEKIFQSVFIQPYKDKLYKCDTSHYADAVKFQTLTVDQEKEIAKIDFSTEIIKMLNDPRLLTDKESGPKITAAKEDVLKFLKYVQTREPMLGVPHGIPDSLKGRPAESQAFENLEKKWRTILKTNYDYQIINSFFRTNIIDPKHATMINEIQKAIKECIPPNMFKDQELSALLKSFAECQCAKENFYYELEEKLRIIIYSYQLESIVKSRSSSSSASLQYDIHSENTLLTTIAEAIKLCATKWGAELQIIEEDSYKKIYDYERQLKNTHAEVDLKEQNQINNNQPCHVKTQLHSELIAQRSSVIRLWANSWRLLRQEQMKAAGEPEEVIDAEEGMEIHYGYAALQHRGQFLGIPRARKNIEDMVEWDSVIDNHFLAFFNQHYAKASIIIDLVDEAINKRNSIEKTVVIEWMKTNLMGNWNKKLFENTVHSITHEINAVKVALENAFLAYKLNTIESHKTELADKILKPLWEILNSQKLINFEDYRQPIERALNQKKDFQSFLQKVMEVIKDAGIKARINEFTSSLHDEEQILNGKLIIKKEYIIEMLLKLNTILANPVQIIKLDAYKKATIAHQPALPVLPVLPVQPQPAVDNTSPVRLPVNQPVPAAPINMYHQQPPQANPFDVVGMPNRMPPQDPQPIYPNPMVPANQPVPVAPINMYHQHPANPFYVPPGNPEPIVPANQPIPDAPIDIAHQQQQPVANLFGLSDTGDLLPLDTLTNSSLDDEILKFPDMNDFLLPETMNDRDPTLLALPPNQAALMQPAPPPQLHIPFARPANMEPIPAHVNRQDSSVNENTEVENPVMEEVE